MRQFARRLHPRVCLGALSALLGLAAWLAAGEDLSAAAAPAPSAQGDRPPFHLTARYPLSGDAAVVIDDAKGRRVRNLFAQASRAQGPAEEAWDLKDDAGAYVAPGQYAWKGIVGPQLAVVYGLTPYPNLQNFFPELMPWPVARPSGAPDAPPGVAKDGMLTAVLVGHSGENGWLSDHAPNWACATSGDHVYFAASMAEAGTTLIECDLEGRRLWGQHDFGAWIGVNQMAADAESLFVLAGNDVVHRLDLATHKDLNQFQPNQGSNRRGWRSAMAARDGKVVFAYTGEQVFDNAGTPEVLDAAQCLPPPPDGGLLVRLLRMAGDPPGGDGVNPSANQPQGNGRLFLEFQPLGDKQVAVIAFQKAVPLGSVVFPWPAGEGNLQLSVLKPDAPYPPRPDRSEDWTPFESSGGPGWNCVTAPPRTMTRAVRILFEPKGKADGFRRLEGMRLLNRRFANLMPSAQVRVSSGKVSAAGEWDAERSAPVAPDKPGVFVMQWKTPQKICGLALKEIDGATAEIDVWQGPVTGDVPLEGAAHDKKSKEPGWRNAATYVQKRRNGDYGGAFNAYACYLDGYVDFGETVETAAVRIRITEQWLDNGPEGGLCRRHDGRGEHGVHRRNSYCMWLDSRVCKIMGVAVLSPVGNDPPRDPMTYERLEIWDGKAGKLLKELPVRPGWHGLSFAPDGSLYVIEKSHEVISKVDMETGKLAPLITDAMPSCFTIGPDGLFYIRPWGDDGKRPILVYDGQGKRVRTIGKPGGFQPGLWDPQRFVNPHRMCVDRKGSLWIVESQDNPRRIVQYKTDGTFVKEILGNTHYGGGGTMDRTNASRAFHGGVEFEMDWKKHTSRIKACFGDAFLGGEPVTRKVKDRLYLVTAPLTLNDRQGVGTVYLYNEREGTVRLAAAMGDAALFAPLRRSDILSLLPKGEVFRDYEFLWFDRDGNGKVDAAEVDFQRKKGPVAVGPFDEALGCCGNGVYYQAAEILASGVPAYKRTPAPGWPTLRLKDGSWLTLHGQMKPDARTENFVVAPDGEKRWGYPATGGVSGLGVPGWQPGLVTNQLCLVGQETAAAGDLGEFFVVNDNTGQWRIWTADGLIAGNLIYHKDDPRARFLGPPEAKFDSRFDPVAGRQEQFHGFFTRTEPDNRYFLEIGFTHMSFLEVQGLEKFRRAGGTFQVTAADIERARRWAAGASPTVK